MIQQVFLNIKTYAASRRQLPVHRSRYRSVPWPRSGLFRSACPPGRRRRFACRPSRDNRPWLPGRWDWFSPARWSLYLHLQNEQGKEIHETIQRGGIQDFQIEGAQKIMPAQHTSWSWSTKLCYSFHCYLFFGGGGGGWYQGKIYFFFSGSSFIKTYGKNS